MLKKIIKIFLFSIPLFLFLLSSVFSEESVSKNSEIKMVGPSSIPNIKGPSISAPSKYQIDEMKRFAGHEEFIIEDSSLENGEPNFIQKVMSFFTFWF